ncbi:histidine-containing phosphotransfer protein 1-like isoform X2 [Rhodamnia argentea]|uniref:Histidine-containing phosphotransfer protein n=1 Tax=Rhodamnia argentea TaxID=178133 RepID=A0A8B8PJK5_9MYRT|nr:histidine-containing phosphotransfer protein 1-like isoform X2 [Rhodamnia argentea]
MDVAQLKRQLFEYTTLLFHEGFLDEQFTQLQQLQDENNPDFVVEVVSLFFDDSERLLNELATALDQQNIDFNKVDAHVHQLKGSSSRNDGSFNFQILSEMKLFFGITALARREFKESASPSATPARTRMSKGASNVCKK